MVSQDLPLHPSRFHSKSQKGMKGKEMIIQTVRIGNEYADDGMETMIVMEVIMTEWKRRSDWELMAMGTARR